MVADHQGGQHQSRVISSIFDQTSPRTAPSIAPSFDPRRYIASTLGFSFRATTIFVFSRVSDFSMRTSCFVHGRLRVTFFAISFPM
jgi:hypothetical protein